MSEGMFVALSGAVARQTQLDQMSHNLANAETPGFKAQRTLMRAQAGDATRGEHFAQVMGSFFDMSEGAVKNTNNPLDVAVSGRGFIRVGGRPGEQVPANQALLMRSGTLRVDDQGQLVTQDGRPVLSDSGEPMIVEASAEEVMIAADGAIWDNFGVVGHLGLVEVNDPSALQARGGGLMMTAQANTKPAEQAQVLSKMLEEGNLSPVEGMVELISLHRHFEAMNSLIQTHRRMDTRAVELGRQQGV